MHPEPMTEPLAETAGHAIGRQARAAILDLLAGRDAMALGPGLSLDPETQALVRELVAEVSQPMVVDADALSALAGHLDVLDRAAGPRILTPHPGEMARMLGRRSPRFRAIASRRRGSSRDGIARTSR
jgi:NAD(P)H-hydrate epimerase